MNLRVLAEAGPSIGLGHFVRSLALVQMIKKGITPIFYGRDKSLIKDILLQHGIDFHRIDSLAGFLNHLSNDDIVLMDGYGYDTDFQKAVKEKCHKLFVIDDKHDQTYCADFIINPAPGISEDDYKTIGDCKFLLGPKYALLRPAFLRSEKTKNTNTPSSVVVCFGGADPDNLSHKVVELLLSFQKLKKVHLIIGLAYSFYNSLGLLLNDARLQVSKALNEEKMATALIEADFAVVPSSGILYECIGVGTPAISGYYVDNQINTYKGWLSKKAIIGVEGFDMHLLKNKVQKILSGDIDLNQFSANGVVDGKSPERYSSIFKEIIESYEV